MKQAFGGICTNVALRVHRLGNISEKIFFLNTKNVRRKKLEPSKNLFPQFDYCPQLKNKIILRFFAPEFLQSLVATVTG